MLSSIINVIYHLCSSSFIILYFKQKIIYLQLFLKITCSSNPNSVALNFTEKEVPRLLRCFRMSHEKIFLEAINVAGTQL